MIQILACYSKAGSSWDAAIDIVCQKRGILHFTNADTFKQAYDDRYLLMNFDPDCDEQILYQIDDCLYLWGWECKNVQTDLHNSMIGKDVSFEDEIIQHLVRNTTLNHYGAILGGSGADEHDIMMFTGMCSKHGVNWNWCSTIEKAVEKCFELVEQADRVIDCRKPIYINKSADIPQFAAMLATFWKMTGDRALQIYDKLLSSGYPNPKEMFDNLDVAFDNKNDNLYRLWIEWYHSAIEPKKNLLKAPNPKVKKTQRGSTP